MDCCDGRDGGEEGIFDGGDYRGEQYMLSDEKQEVREM